MTTRDEYLTRMATCPAFTRLSGVTPLWHPGEGDVPGFCHDEVVRQYHDPRVLADGGVRVEWMIEAWRFAENRAFFDASPDLTDILHVGHLVEPRLNGDRMFRTSEVYIGNGRGAPAEWLPHLVTRLQERARHVMREQGQRGPHANEYRALWQWGPVHRDELLDRFALLLDRSETVDDWYLAFEAVHPLADGNGRTGKILHNWLLGTLGEPVLVADYFGHGNP